MTHAKTLVVVWGSEPQADPELAAIGWVQSPMRCSAGVCEAGSKKEVTSNGRGHR